MIIISATAPPSGSYGGEADYDLTDEEALALFRRGHEAAGVSAEGDSQ